MRAELHNRKVSGLLHLYQGRKQMCCCVREHCFHVSTTRQQGRERPYHVVARKKFLQELGLFVHHRFDDELIIAGHIEDGAAGSWIGQLNQWLVAQGVLAKAQADKRILHPIKFNPIPFFFYLLFGVFTKYC